jgi:hypothetical protein
MDFASSVEPPDPAVDNLDIESVLSVDGITE